jgi:hypothetical protein
MAALRWRGGACGGGVAGRWRREGVVLLVLLPGEQDALVANGGQAGQPQHERVTPMRRIQPRSMLLVAVFLMVELSRS